MDLFSNVEISSGTMPQFQVAEGFARITRNGKTDVYLVQNLSLPTGYKASLAFDLDDFDDERSVGKPMVLTKDDQVEHLGKVADIFAEKAPIWGLVTTVKNSIPRDAGLLPAVRALCWLRERNTMPNMTETRNIIQRALDDYASRRAALVI